MDQAAARDHIERLTKSMFDRAPRCFSDDTLELAKVFKQGEESEVSPTGPVACMSSSDARLEQHFPDNVDSTPTLETLSTSM